MPAAGESSSSMVKSVSAETKVEAVLAETAAKKAVLHETYTTNERLQQRIVDLHTAEAKAAEAVAASGRDLDEAKKRQTLQRYYRNRSAESAQQRQTTIARLAATPSSLIRPNHRPSPSQQTQSQKVAAAVNATLAARAAARAAEEEETDRRAPPLLYDTAALAELRLITDDLEQRRDAARAKRDRLRAAVADMTSLRHKLEGAATKQLQHTDAIAGDLATTRRDIAKEARGTAKESKSVKQLERSVEQWTRKCEALAEEAKDQYRHAERLMSRLRRTDHALGSLQKNRGESKRRAEGELSSSANRDETVRALRAENSELIQWLLNDAPPFVNEGEMASIRERAAKLAQDAAAAAGPEGIVPDVCAKAAALGGRLGNDGHERGLPKSPKTAETEARLYHELEEAIRDTKQTIARMRI